MNRATHMVTAAAIALVCALPAHAGVPQSLVHHGFLTDAAGTPVNGAVSFTFALYASADGADKVWTEEIASWQVTSGYYALTLGLATPFGDVFAKNGALWLEITAGGQTLTPRQKVSAVPFAMVADDAVGNIHPASITVNGAKIIDETGKWAGDPSWIPGIKSITAAAPLTGGTITDSGSIGIAKATAASDGYVAKEDWARFDAKQAPFGGPCGVGFCVQAIKADGTPDCVACGNGSGSVMQVDTGVGLKGGPITVSGTVDLDQVVIDQWYVNAGGDKMSGTLGITPVGGLNVGTDQLVCAADGNVGVGTAAPAAKLHVAGDLRVDGNVTLGSGGLLKKLAFYNESEAISQSSLASYTTKGSIDLEAGTYLITMSAEVRCSSSGNGVFVRLQNTTSSATLSGPTIVYLFTTTDYAPVSFIKQVTLATASTVAIQFARETLGTAYIKNARISALRVD